MEKTYMADRNGIKWNREETILAYELYCRTPFSRISQNNPEIRKLAELMGRTPGSVGLKMHNLAHYDPELQKRNIVAMAHGSKLDGEIFNEFCNDWEELSYQAQVIRAKMQNVQVENIINMDDLDEIPPGKYRERLVKKRIGQYFFRMSVLSSYRNRCCITGMQKSDLLIASHIKPWNVSDEKTERTNPCNGLCLNSLHDKAFDMGLITLNKDYKLIVSKEMKHVSMDTVTKEWFHWYEGKKIILPDKFLPGKSFIEYHNDVIFLG